MPGKHKVPTLSSPSALATLELTLGHNTGAEGSSSARVAKRTQGRAICSHREERGDVVILSEPTISLAMLPGGRVFRFWLADLTARQLTSTTHSTGQQGFFVRNGVLGLPVSVCSPEVVAGGSFCVPDPGQEPWRACCPLSN